MTTLEIILLILLGLGFFLVVLIIGAWGASIKNLTTAATRYAESTEALLDGYKQQSQSLYDSLVIQQKYITALESFHNSDD